MGDFVERLLGHPTLGRLVVHHRRLEPGIAAHAAPRAPLVPDVAAALEALGIGPLYRHQALGLDHLRDGADVLLATPTASGKTLLFAVALLESFLREPRSRGLLLYPTKALAQDQLGTFRGLVHGLGPLRPPRFEIYDGDTPAALRKRIRADPPNALITNPDMLHLGILGHHAEWEPFLRDLRYVVLDELHVYRGIFGAHVHHILARLQRLCARYGSAPRFIAASATVGNPAEFGRTLVGREFRVVGESGAPQAGRDVVFLNPVAVSPYTVAVRVVAEAIRAGQRCIAFAKARRVTELLYTWLVRQEPGLRDRVAPYRAGYLPHERRRLEARLFRGELSGVLATSALELGIDVGGLDVCVLVGYPGSLISTWQRIGRVGRGRDGVVVLIALPDSLDQYVVHHPELLFDGRAEAAVLDPWNPLIAGRHLVCAASEEPLRADELERAGAGATRVARGLVAEGRLLQDAEGTRYYSLRRRPQREVNPRSAAEPFRIVDPSGERLLGTIDGQRVYHECHPGAVYLHGGQSYRVLELDPERRRVTAEAARLDYYTVVLGDKETEILERLEAGRIGEFHTGLGRLRVTVRIHAYQKKRLFDGEPLSTHPLEVPPLVFETRGFWIELPRDLPAAFAGRGRHFMGGIHAVEHATIGLFPLEAISDRDDVGGISYTGHPQTGGPAIFVYDGVAGGAGLADRGYLGLPRLLGRTLERLEECGCEDGCPGCIQSPKCGNGNKPLDKEAAREVLRLLVGREPLAAYGVVAVQGSATDRLVPFVAAPREPAGGRHGIRRAGNVEPSRTREAGGSSGPGESVRTAGVEVTPIGDPPATVSRAAVERPLFLDLETRRGPEDVGGWRNAFRMGLGLAVVYDSASGAYRTYLEPDVDRLLLDLALAERVVGFNVDRFDLVVLSGYTSRDLTRIRTLDLLSEVRRRLGFRVSLGHLSEVNLGETKGGDGRQSLQWWREGRIDLIERYCRKDVELTRRLYDLGRERGFLLYRDREARTLRVPVAW